MPRLHAPRPADLALTVLCVVLMLVELRLHHLPPAVGSVSTIVLAALPVLVRRQFPVGSLVLAFTALFVLAQADAGIYNTIPGPAVLCAHEVASHYGRRVSLAAGAVCAVLTMAILQIYSPHAVLSWGTAQNMALVVLPLALGVAAHDRRAWTQALLDRAATAERNQEETARRRVSEERLRIARDVHDAVAHALVTINVQAGVGAYLVKSDPDEAHVALRTIKQVSGDALTDLRSTLGVLREATGAPPPGIDALGELAESMRTAGIDLTLDIDDVGPHLPTSVGTTAYRVVQEALTNTLRHAGPTCAHITVTRDRSALTLRISDDGGTPTDLLSRSGSGNGLRGMRERATALGGTLEAGPRPTGGWLVKAVLPLEKEVDAP
ncbi:sensor histidine kinase [Kineosporia succinea]|uniref:histidine kinase n=1 Tax=Kineosporia succinea TaxID=84632 RepID=A0ABT9P6P5_9ACTN|nr:sensor histidine kinase [Kineosporia succinea]MDP9827735.1 signal transduction histidine kinase [Kineosporia succinea]